MHFQQALDTPLVPQYLDFRNWTTESVSRYKCYVHRMGILMVVIDAHSD